MPHCGDSTARLSIVLPPSTRSGFRRLPHRDARRRRRRSHRTRARPTHHARLSCVVGSQRRRERGERAAARRKRNRTVGLPRGRRPVRGDRGGAGGREGPRPAPARPPARRVSRPSRSPPTCGRGSSRSRRRSSCGIRAIVARSPAVGSTTTRSSGSCARATTPTSAARRGRPRRRSARSWQTMSASWPGSGTRLPTLWGIGTGSRSRCPPRR